MPTSPVIARTAAATCDISRRSGPRTAATMQNSVAPVAAVALAASTSSAMSSHTALTGEENCPDWEQKWQSSGQPPVFTERSEEHTSELQSHVNIVCRLLL